MSKVTRDDGLNQSGLWLFLIAIGLWTAQAIAIAMLA